MSNYLIHYGTKRHSGRYPYGSGEKPYQREPKRHWLFKKKPRLFNKDGLITEAGVEHLYSLAKNPNYKVSAAADKRPVPSIITKGTNIYRIASKDEPVNDSSRKYVTFDNDDRQTYLDFAREGYFDDDPVENVYITTKDVKIADGKEVMDHFISTYGDILSTYGDPKLQDLYYNVYDTMKDLPYVSDVGSRFESFSKKDQKFVKKVNHSFEAVTKDITRAISEGLFKDTKINSEMMTYYANKGYDAITDIEDWFESVNINSPIIMINPTETMKYVETNSIWKE